MKTGFYFLATSLLLFISLSCSKGGSVDDTEYANNPSDVTAPVLTINTPAPDQVFNNGNSINVTGRVTDDLGLYRGTIRITNDLNGDVLKEQAYEIHGILAYNFNISHVAAVSVASNYTVTVWFEDHGSNTAARSVKIKVNP